MKKQRLALLCFLASSALVTACGSAQHKGGAPTITSPKPGTTNPGAPGHSFNVTAYGADPSGGKDSTVGIRKAISAAEGAAGSTVYIPAGRYILNDKDNAKADFEIANRPVTIQGAGAQTTTIVEEIGAKTGQKRGRTIFEILTGPNGVPGGGDGTRISGLTLDSASFDGGTTILDFANKTVISDDVVHGARSDHTYNTDQFGLRVITICKHDNLPARHRNDNTVENLVLTGQGKAGNVDLDISCQENATISNVDDTGNGLGLYIVDGVHVTNFTHHDGTIQQTPTSISISPPANNVTINNFTTYGNGGDLRPSPNGYSITNTVISNETMKIPGYFLRLGDATNTTITNSKILAVRVAPAHVLNGVKVINSSIGPAQCNGPGKVSALSGIAC